MKAATEMRILLVLYIAAGMIVSYLSGYTLMYDDLKDIRIELVLERSKVKEAKASAKELRARAYDRDRIELDLRQCYERITHHTEALEDIKWQMLMVLNTCPGRERPPRLPRP